VTDELQNRERERRFMLILWASTVALVMALGAGMAGGWDLGYPASIEEWLGWLIPASPIVPLVLWLKARKQVRNQSRS
jgi:hypothetical protein